MIKPFCAVNTKNEQAKVNEDIIEQLAQLHTIMDLVLKQNQASVHAVTHQPPKAPTYDDPFFDEDAYFISNQAVDFWNNPQGSNPDYWRQSSGNQGQNFNHNGMYRDKSGGYYER